MPHRLRVTFILPALIDTISPSWRPLPCSLFPPLGLSTLAAHLEPDDEAVIVDEHVAPVPIGDTPDLAVIQVYATSATRAYALADRYRARRVFVALGGLHVTARPEEAAAHADALFLGPGEHSFPACLADVRARVRARSQPLGQPADHVLAFREVEDGRRRRQGHTARRGHRIA